MLEPETTLLEILSKVTALFVMPGFLVPPVLMVLKFLHYQAISESQADQIITWIKPLWPVITLQYDSVKKSNSLGSEYYAILAIVSLIIILITLFLSIFRYCVAHRSIQMPGAREFLVCLLAPPCYFLFALSDAPTEKYVGRWHFSADDFGAYYLTQYLKFIGCGVLVLLCFLSIVRIVEEILRHLRADHIK